MIYLKLDKSTLISPHLKSKIRYKAKKKYYKYCKAIFYYDLLCTYLNNCINICIVTKSYLYLHTSNMISAKVNYIIIKSIAFLQVSINNAKL